MANGKYQTYDMHDLRIVDTFLRQSSKLILNKSQFCQIMEYGVHDSTGRILVEGYHFKKKMEASRQRAEKRKDMQKKAMLQNEATMPLSYFYTSSWVQLRRRIKGSLWSYLCNYIDISTENGSDKKPTKTNSYTYRYIHDGFSIYNLVELKGILVSETSPKIPKDDDSRDNKKQYKSKLSGKNSQLRGTNDIRRRINDVVQDTNFDIEKREILKSTFISALARMKESAKKEIEKALNLVNQIVKEYPENWKTDCQKILAEARDKNKSLENELEYADFLWAYATFLVTYDIYDGAYELYDKALSIYNNELRFNCSTDQYAKYISIYDSISSLASDMVNWDSSLKYAEDGIRAMGNRYKENDDTILLWLSLTNRKVMALLFTDKIDESLNLAIDTLSYVKNLHAKNNNDWSYRRLMYSYWLVGFCSFCKANTSNAHSDWRYAWSVIDEANDFIKSMTQELNDYEYQERKLNLILLKLDLYNTLPRTIYLFLSEEDWEKIHSFRHENKCLEALKLIKGWDDLNSDGTPNFSKASKLEQISQAMIDVHGSFKELLPDAIVKQYLNADEYILETFIIYADLYFPVYGKKLSHYYVVSTEYLIELFQTVYFLKLFREDLESAFSHIIKCVERLTNALFVANDTDDEDFISMIRSSGLTSYNDLVEMFCEYKLHLLIDYERKFDFYVWMFFIDTYKYQIYDDNMEMVGETELKRIQNEAKAIIKVADKTLIDTLAPDSEAFLIRKEILSQNEEYFDNII